MPNTPILGLPYPGPSNTADVPYYLQQLAETVEVNFGAWVAYTPVLTASTTNPTLGTGSSAVGRYRQFGKTVLCRGEFRFGTSGISAGSGQYSMSLPVPGNFAIAGAIIGSAGMSPTSSVWAPCIPFHQSASLVYFWGPATSTSAGYTGVGNAGVLGSAFTTNGIIRWDLTYEAA